MPRQSSTSAMRMHLRRLTHKILKKVSGRNLGERDATAWQRWLDGERR